MISIKLTKIYQICFLVCFVFFLVATSSYGQTFENQNELIDERYIKQRYIDEIYRNSRIVSVETTLSSDIEQEIVQHLDEIFDATNISVLLYISPKLDYQTRESYVNFIYEQKRKLSHEIHVVICIAGSTNNSTVYYRDQVDKVKVYYLDQLDKTQQRVIWSEIDFVLRTMYALSKREQTTLSQFCLKFSQKFSIAMLRSSLSNYTTISKASVKHGTKLTLVLLLSFVFWVGFETSILGSDHMATNLFCSYVGSVVFLLFLELCGFDNSQPISIDWLRWSLALSLFSFLGNATARFLSAEYVESISLAYQIKNNPQEFAEYVKKIAMKCLVEIANNFKRKFGGG